MAETNCFDLETDCFDLETDCFDLETDTGTIQEGCDACNYGYWCRGCDKIKKINGMMKQGMCKEYAEGIYDIQYSLNGCRIELVPCFCCNRKSDKYLEHKPKEWMIYNYVYDSSFWRSTRVKRLVNFLELMYGEVTPKLE